MRTVEHPRAQAFDDEVHTDVWQGTCPFLELGRPPRLGLLRGKDKALRPRRRLSISDGARIKRRLRRLVNHDQVQPRAVENTPAWHATNTCTLPSWP